MSFFEETWWIVIHDIKFGNKKYAKIFHFFSLSPSQKNWSTSSKKGIPAKHWSLYLGEGRLSVWMTFPLRSQFTGLAFSRLFSAWLDWRVDWCSAYHWRLTSREVRSLSKDNLDYYDQSRTRQARGGERTWLFTRRKRNLFDTYIMTSVEMFECRSKSRKIMIGMSILMLTTLRISKPFCHIR